MLGGENSYHFLLAQTAIDYPLIGNALHRHLNTRGNPISFRSMPYLVELYKDLPLIDGADICKAVQTGLSELMIQLMIERSGWQGRVAAYVLPTFTIRDRFVQNRINPLLNIVPDYRKRAGLAGNKAGSTGNLKLKRFGSGAMMFLGSNTVGDFLEFSADVLIIDEFDQCDPANLAKARDRLRASPYPQLFHIGNPTLPRVGVARLFDQSDRRLWFVKCDRCGERQPIDWFQNVVERSDAGAWVPRDKARLNPDSGDIRPICRRCSLPMAREGVDGGWVPEMPSRGRRGYRISRLDVTNESYRRLYNEWCSAQGVSEQLAAFYTSVLGRPFEFSGSRLTISMLERVATGPEIDYVGGSEYEGKVVTMGVDVGSLLHVNISVIEEQVEKDDDGEVVSKRTIRRCVFNGTTASFDAVRDMIERYRVDLCVIDAMPETRKAQELRDYFMNTDAQVWLCRFHPTPRIGSQRYGLKMNYRDRVVTVDRTQVFDASFDDIKDCSRLFAEDCFTALGWSEQMRAPVRVLDENRSRIIWTEGSTPDHYRLADIYDRIAFDLTQMGGSYFSE